MKGVYNIKAKSTFAGPGVYGYDAEATVKCEDGKELFVHVNDYAGMKHFTVSETSTYDMLTNNSVSADGVSSPVYIEMYTKQSEAKASEYWSVFKVLKDCLNLISKGL